MLQSSNWAVWKLQIKKVSRWLWKSKYNYNTFSWGHAHVVIIRKVATATFAYLANKQPGKVKRQEAVVQFHLINRFRREAAQSYTVQRQNILWSARHFDQADKSCFKVRLRVYMPSGFGVLSSPELSHMNIYIYIYAYVCKETPNSDLCDR